MSATVSRAVRRGPALAAALAVAAVLAAAPADAPAVENGGIVVGTVVLAPAERRGPVPVRNQGFVRRVPNALKSPRALDPLPQIVVVLDGATPPEEDRRPPTQPVRYSILGESFEFPLLPVVVGSVVEIRNAGRGAPRLYSPGAADLVPPDPIGPRGERKTRKIEPALQTFELRDRESIHLSGRIVAFPHRYTALVAADGKFTIKDVAPGMWKVRIWYRDGWAEAPEEVVEVVAKKESKPVKVTLPAKLVTRPAR
ncbi:MAG TPA: hypothetical protein VK698_25980 [Kofleriaceae bacterium]|nr:hypothetical protein [Kofleriaceae bacterium]